MKKIPVLFLTCLLVSNAIPAQTRLFKPGSVKGADAVITSGSRCTSLRHSNYGAVAENNILARNGSSDDCGSVVSRTLIRFDELNTLPGGVVITHAELRLFNVAAKNTGGNTPNRGEQTGWVRRITSGWMENNVNWNHQPGFTTSAEAVIPATNNVLPEKVSVNVTAQVIAMMANGQNNGFILMAANEQQNSNFSFASSDNNDPRLWPELYIVYRGACDANFIWCASTSRPGEYNFTVENTIPDYIYTWSFGDGTREQGTSVSHSYSVSGACEISLTAFSNETEDSCTENISICVNQASGNRPFTFTAITADQKQGSFSKRGGTERADCAADFTWCGSTSYPGVYNYNVETIVPGFDYNWSFGDGGFTTGTSVSHTYIAAGIYETGLEALNAATAESCKEYVSLCVNEIPDCIASFTATPTYNVNEFLFRSETSVGLPVASYDWDYGDGSVSSGGPDAVYAYNAPGVYMVCLTVTYDNLCMVRYCAAVTATGPGLRNSVRRVKPGENETGTAAKNNTSGNCIRVIPNPVTGSELTLNINMTGNAVYRYTIFGTQGTPLLTGTKTLQQGSQNVVLDIQRLPAGKYWIEFSNNRQQLRSPFIKL